MAIYRPSKPRWPVAVAAGIAGLLVGLITGLVMGRDEPDVSDSAALIKTALVSAAGSLEVAAVEYEESVENGEVLRDAEYQGALGALESSRTRFSEARPALESLFPSQVAPIDDLYDEALRMMEGKEDAQQVVATLEELEALLKGEAAP